MKGRISTVYTRRQNGVKNFSCLNGVSLKNFPFCLPGVVRWRQIFLILFLFAEKVGKVRYFGNFIVTKSITPALGLTWHPLLS